MFDNALEYMLAIMYTALCCSSQLLYSNFAYFFFVFILYSHICCHK